MFKQIFVPDEQNYFVSISPNLYGCEVKVL